MPRGAKRGDAATRTFGGEKDVRPSDRRRYFARVCAKVPPKVKEYNPQNLSNTAWAIAKRVSEGPAVTAAAEKAVYFSALGAIVEEVLAHRVDDVHAQNLVSLAYALVVANFDAPAYLFEALPRRLAAVVDKANHQDLSNACWATAKAGGGGEGRGAETFAVAERELLKRGVGPLDNPQNISNTAWAFAKAGRGSDDLWTLVGAAAQRQCHLFRAQNVSNTLYAWALAKRPDGDALLEALANEIPKRKDELCAQDVASGAVIAFGMLVRSVERACSCTSRRKLWPRFERVRTGRRAGSSEGTRRDAFTAATWIVSRGDAAGRRIGTRVARPRVWLLPAQVANMAWAYATLGFTVASDETQYLKKRHQDNDRRAPWSGRAES